MALRQKDKGAACPAQVAVTVDLDSSEGSKQGSVTRMASMTVKHKKVHNTETFDGCNQVPGAAHSPRFMATCCRGDVERSLLTEFNAACVQWFDSEQWTILRARPRILLISAAVLAILLVPSVVGVVYAAQASVESAKHLAYNGPCLQLAAGIRQKLYSIFWGVKALVSYIRMNPSCRWVRVAWLLQAVPHMTQLKHALCSVR